MSIPEDIKRASEAHREYNDCGVIGIALAAGVSYESAHNALRKAGRRDRRGCTMFEIKVALRNLGYTMEVCLLPWTKRCKTAITLAKHLPSRGRFIAEYRGHVAGCRAGKVLDWTDGRRHHVRLVWRVAKAK